jgi:hypothetical protein
MIVGEALRFLLRDVARGAVHEVFRGLLESLRMVE